MKPVVIFGNSKIAEVIHFYLSHDSDYTVAAFTVDRQYITGKTMCALPVVPFEDITRDYPPAQYDMFIAVGYKNLNTVRTEKCKAAKEKGYALISYISSKTVCWDNVTIGENCFIFENQTIQPFVTIGNNVIVWSGNHIGHHSTIDDNCFISSHVVISGDVHIGKNCFVGVNATIANGVSVAENCIIGAGSVILHDTQQNSIYPTKSTKPSSVPSDKVSL